MDNGLANHLHYVWKKKGSKMEWNMMCFLHCVWEFIKHRMEMEKKVLLNLHVLLFFLFKIERKSIFHLNFSEGIWVFLLLLGIRIPSWPFYSFLLNFQTKNRLNIIKKNSFQSIPFYSIPSPLQNKLIKIIV